MPRLFRRQQPDTVGITPEPLAAAARQIGQLLGQLQLVDQLTMAALVNGHDTDLALDIRARLGLPMAGPRHTVVPVIPGRPADEQHWIVARDGGRHCEHCETEITRGQAYTIQPDTGGLLTHIHCPDGGEGGS